jgi:glycosyltransferase involved in cell wall biosynthesis
MLVGQVGRLTPWKGQETIIEMAKLAKQEGLPIRFVIIGDDSYGLPGYLDHLMHLAESHELGDQVLFTRWLDDMPGAYRSLDLLVHPVREPEPFGLVIAEAMACRTPVAVFDYGGAAEVIGSSEHGILVNQCDLHALWQAVKWVYNNPEEASALGSRARSRVLAKFSMDRFSDQMLELYDSLSWQLV